MGMAMGTVKTLTITTTGDNDGAIADDDDGGDDGAYDEDADVDANIRCWGLTTWDDRLL